METKRNLTDEASDVMLFTEMFRFFGAVYAVKFFGYCVLLGAAWNEGEPKTRAVERLMKLGLPRRTGFQALRDLDAFKQHLETEVLKRDLTRQEVIRLVTSGGLVQSSARVL